MHFHWRCRTRACTANRGDAAERTQSPWQQASRGARGGQSADEHRLCVIERSSQRTREQSGSRALREGGLHLAFTGTACIGCFGVLTDRTACYVCYALRHSFALQWPQPNGRNFLACFTCMHVVFSRRTCMLCLLLPCAILPPMASKAFHYTLRVARGDGAREHMARETLCARALA